MIARNSAADLERSVGSVKSLADEILLTDTGSQDETVAIARSLGASVDHFPWCDDFSAARNHVLERASGDWIFWLDSDEALVPKGEKEVRRTLESGRALAYQVIREEVSTLDEPCGHSEMWQLRLFPNHPRLRFKGRCHPHFGDRLPELATQKDSIPHTGSAVRLIHWGYSESRVRTKLERSLRLLRMELDDRPGQLYYLVELLRTELLLKEENAERTLGEAIQLAVPIFKGEAAVSPSLALLLEVLLQIPEDAWPKDLDPNLAWMRSREWFPTSPPLVWWRAQRNYLNGDYEAAEGELRTLLHIGSSGEYDRHVSFKKSILGAEAKLNLSACLVKLGKLDEAQTLCEGLVDHPEWGDGARSNLSAIHSLRHSGEN